MSQISNPTSFGLKFGEKGAHTSRTIMLAELTELLRLVPQATSHAEFREAIVDNNLLGKKTLATRKLTVQRLSELYGLDVSIPIFRVMRSLWDVDRRGRPLLAFLVAYARDPLLRATADCVMRAPKDARLSASDIDDALTGAIGNRLNPAVRNKVARNASSSWTQSGHLTGHVVKRRSTPVGSTASVTMALVLGFVSGNRGLGLLNSEWIRILDCSRAELMALIEAANRQSLIDFKQLGDLVEIRFPKMLTREEEGV